MTLLYLIVTLTFFQRKISANASAILAKHNITLNLPSCTNGSNKDLEGPAVENRLIEVPDETWSNQPEIHSPPPADDGVLLDFSDVSANGRNTNNSNISGDLLQLNEGAIHSLEPDSLIRIVGDIESEKARHDIPVSRFLFRPPVRHLYSRNKATLIRSSFRIFILQKRIS